jgi:hypothetical protein
MRTARASLAIALALAAGCAHGEGLGTLFYTPAEREQLDRQRRGEEVSPGAPLAREHAITGFVQRSDGRGTVWVDGRPIRVADPRARVFDPTQVRAYSKSGDEVKIQPEKR